VNKTKKYGKNNGYKCRRQINKNKNNSKSNIKKNGKYKNKLETKWKKTNHKLESVAQGSNLGISSHRK
jgi:uncharacterized FlaG/YvyC family protein